MHDGKNTLKVAGTPIAGSSSVVIPAPQPLITTTEPNTLSEKPKPRVKQRKHTPIYDPIIGIIGALISAIAAGFIWWIGAILTLTFLQTRLGINLAAMGSWKWLIPISITGIEIAFWPQKNQSFNFRMLFLLVAGIDLITSVDGGHTWLVDRGLSVQWVAWMLGCIAAFLCSFWPERLIRSAVYHFWINGKSLIQDLRLVFA